MYRVRSVRFGGRSKVAVWDPDRFHMATNRSLRGLYIMRRDGPVRWSGKCQSVVIKVES